MSEVPHFFDTPRVMHETAHGITVTSIADEMLQAREIALVGSIDQELAHNICQQLRYLERIDGTAEITLFVASPGGSVSAGLGIYDTLRFISCPIRTVCLDLAASMGSIIYLAGDVREIAPHAEIMIHDPLISQGAGGSALTVAETSKRLLELRRRLTQIMVERTGLSTKRIHAMTSKDTYLSAEHACELGFAHQIIPARKEPLHD